VFCGLVVKKSKSVCGVLCFVLCKSMVAFWGV
jgi:hypothetical protein